MAAADWSEVSGSASSVGMLGVSRAASRGFPRPGGGDSSCHMMRSWHPNVFAALHARPQAPNTNFNPLLKGADIRGALCAYRGACRPFLFAAATGQTGDSVAYVAGLVPVAGTGSHRLVVCRGVLSRGPRLETDGYTEVMNTGVPVPVGTWIHLRLEVRVNGDGSIDLTVLVSTTGDVTRPRWEQPGGAGGRPVEEHEDPGIALVGGWGGFGCVFDEAGAVSLHDHLELIKQT